MLAVTSVHSTGLLARAPDRQTLMLQRVNIARSIIPGHHPESGPPPEKTSIQRIHPLVIARLMTILIAQAHRIVIESILAQLQNSSLSLRIRSVLNLPCVSAARLHAMCLGVAFHDPTRRWQMPRLQPLSESKLTQDSPVPLLR